MRMNRSHHPQVPRRDAAAERHATSTFGNCDHMLTRRTQTARDAKLRGDANCCETETARRRETRARELR